MSNEDPIERLARRTAEENDRLARERIREMNSVSPEAQKRYFIIAAVCGVIILVIFISLFALFSH